MTTRRLLARPPQTQTQPKLAGVPTPRTRSRLADKLKDAWGWRKRRRGETWSRRALEMGTWGAPWKLLTLVAMAGNGPPSPLVATSCLHNHARCCMQPLCVFVGVCVWWFASHSFINYGDCDFDDGEIRWSSCMEEEEAASHYVGKLTWGVAWHVYCAE